MVEYANIMLKELADRAFPCDSPLSNNCKENMDKQDDECFHR